MSLGERTNLSFNYFRLLPLATLLRYAVMKRHREDGGSLEVQFAGVSEFAIYCGSGHSLDIRRSSLVRKQKIIT